jgi:hypothetical protein
MIIPLLVAISLIWSCAMRPSAFASAKPEEKMMTPPTLRRSQASTVSLTLACGIANTAQSTDSGKLSTEAKQGRPPMLERLGFIKYTSPRYSARSRFSMMLAPKEPGVGEAPTIAIEAGQSKRLMFFCLLELSVGTDDSAAFDPHRSES